MSRYLPWISRTSLAAVPWRRIQAGRRPGERSSPDHGDFGQVADDVGARWHEIDGDDPAHAIAAFAQEHQITQIVIGSSQRSRWQQLTGGGSKVARIIREAGKLGIDVHVIALRKETAVPAASDRAPG
jgi:two-component system, OmpR family, sensor histidine kinase KdpD